MKNLIITLCLLVVVSFTYAQIDVVGPDGKVGIGNVTNPTKPLDVNGDTKIRGRVLEVGSNSGTGNATFALGLGRTGNGKAILDLFPDVGDYNGGLGARFLSNTNGVSNFAHFGASQFVLRAYEQHAPIWFKTRDITRMVVAQWGSVGINTSSPARTLHVNGGAMKIGSSEWDVASDRRLKNNVNVYTKGLSEIMMLEPVSYNYNGKAGIDDTKTTYVGLIAQEYAKVNPEEVSKFEYTEISDQGDDKAYKTGKTEEYLSIDGSSIKYMLVNAVKEQQELIEKQNEVIESLQKAVNELSNQVNGTNSQNSSSTTILVGDSNKAQLSQNTPNPLKDITRIQYFIPENSQSAILQIHDLSGKLYKTIPLIEKGIGNIDLTVKDMVSGLYTYTLEIDGNSIDTKKMIIE